MKLKYVGLKTDGETAFIHLTGITWHPGEVHEVKDEHAFKMLNHPDVFARDTEVKAKITAPAVVKTDDPVKTAGESTVLTLAPGATVTTTESVSITLQDGTVKVLDGLDKDALQALAKELGVAVHPRAGAEKVTAALVAAFPLK